VFVVFFNTEKNWVGGKVGKVRIMNLDKVKAEHCDFTGDSINLPLYKK
jgi:hypothetical protein